MENGLTSEEFFKISRTDLSAPPARVIILDWTDGADADLAAGNLSEALNRVLHVVKQTEQSHRIPWLGIFLAAAVPECVVSLQQVFYGWPRITHLLRFKTSSQWKRVQEQSALEKVLDEVFMQYLRQTNAMMRGGSVASLELFVFTCRPSQEVLPCLDCVTVRSNLGSLKKINLIQVTTPGLLGDYNEFSAAAAAALSSELSSIIEFSYAINDRVSLESIFRSWISDYCRDAEDILLCLPCTADNGQITIQCDAQETVIHPCLLNNGHALCLPADLTGNFQRSLSNVSSSRRTVLEAAGLLKAGSVCESVLYGQPVIIYPSSNWILGWEELEVNRQKFFALSQDLITKDYCLLLRGQGDGIGSICSFFMLFANSNGFMLIKAVACEELHLPISRPSRAPLADTKLTDKIHKALLQVPELPTMNPLSLHSGLLDNLGLCTEPTSASLKSVRTRRAVPSATDARSVSSRGRRGRGTPPSSATTCNRNYGHIFSTMEFPDRI